jgi:hypothetical protein
MPLSPESLAGFFVASNPKVDTAPPLSQGEGKFLFNFRGKLTDSGGIFESVHLSDFRFAFMLSPVAFSNSQFITNVNFDSRLLTRLVTLRGRTAARMVFVEGGRVVDRRSVAPSPTRGPPCAALS